MIFVLTYITRCEFSFVGKALNTVGKLLAALIIVAATIPVGTTRVAVW